MINVFAYRPTIVIGMQDKAFVDSGVHFSNTARIIKIGDPFLSYDPTQSINAISGFEKDAAYFFFATQNLDLSGIADNVAPPDLVITPGTNVFAGKAFAGIAIQTGDFTAAGITAANTSFIYKIGDPYESYIPSEDFSFL